jgi:hypothetical protein
VRSIKSSESFPRSRRRSLSRPTRNFTLRDEKGDPPGGTPIPPSPSSAPPPYAPTPAPRSRVAPRKRVRSTPGSCPVRARSASGSHAVRGRNTGGIPWKRGRPHGFDAGGLTYGRVTERSDTGHTGVLRGCSLVVEHQLPKLRVRVRFSSPAPDFAPRSAAWGLFVVQTNSPEHAFRAGSRLAAAAGLRVGDVVGGQVGRGVVEPRQAVRHRVSPRMSPWWHLALAADCPVVARMFRRGCRRVVVDAAPAACVESVAGAGDSDVHEPRRAGGCRSGIRCQPVVSGCLVQWGRIRGAETNTCGRRRAGGS